MHRVLCRRVGCIPISLDLSCYMRNRNNQKRTFIISCYYTLTPTYLSTHTLSFPPVWWTVHTPVWIQPLHVYAGSLTFQLFKMLHFSFFSCSSLCWIILISKHIVIYPILKFSLDSVTQSSYHAIHLPIFKVKNSSKNCLFLLHPVSLLTFPLEFTPIRYRHPNHLWSLVALFY